MDRKVAAERLRVAELALRAAQRDHDGSEAARRRYTAARIRLRMAERAAQRALQGTVGPLRETPVGHKNGIFR
jgi:hypothetical protein